MKKPGFGKLNKQLLLILSLALGIRIFFSCYDFWFQIFFVDDAFYYFKIARNITSGLGITYDGVQQTNGFQPLFLVLILPFFLLSKNNIILPLHLVAVFSSIISLAIGVLLYKISRTMVDKWYALFIVAIWSCSCVVVDKELNGMETGLNLFLLAAAAFYYTSKIADNISDVKSREILFLGLLLGLAILSRIDSLILSGIIFLHLSYSIIKKCDKGEILNKLLKCGVPLICTVLIFLTPWLLYNYEVSGSIMPVSGQAVRFMSQNYGFAFVDFGTGNDQSTSFLHEIPVRYYLENVFFSFMKILRHLPFLSYVNKITYEILQTVEGNFFLNKGITRVLMLSVVLICFLFLYKSAPRSNGVWKILFFHSACLVIAYSFYIFGHWFFHRYYFVIAFMGTLWGGQILFSIDSRIGERRPSFRKIFKVLIVILFAVLFLLEWKKMFVEIGNNQNLRLYSMVKLVEEKIPEDATIGCFQSGILGYYSDRRIVNLDGVVNQKALLAMKENRLGEYVLDEKITYVMDWPFVLKTLFFRHLGECEAIEDIYPVHKGYFHIYEIGYK